jgi:hypothetical protein
MFSHQARCETFLLLRLQNLRRHEWNTSQVKHSGTYSPVKFRSWLCGARVSVRF